MDSAISVSDFRKTFSSGKPALNGVSMEVQPGEMVALLGASGSGKSTLLRQISGLQKGDPGSKSEICIRGRMLQSGGRLTPEVRAIRSEVGFVFQQFNLVDRLPVLTNVLAGRLHAMPLWRSLAKWFTAAEKELALQMLATVGIGEQAYKRAGQLSGGQQQRAAIARALVQGAKIILADEPIASLDPESARRVMELLRQINRDHGVTVVVSLHQVEHALRYCPRTVALRAGEVVFDGRSTDLTAQRLKDLYGSEHDIPVGDMQLGHSVAEHARHTETHPPKIDEALRLGGAGA
jgi:phosphonate transport system ATP-binding protein